MTRRTSSIGKSTAFRSRSVHGFSTTIAIEADPNDPEDRPVSAEGLAKARQGRRIRRLRHRLGLSQSEFADRYGIPLANIRQYEIGRVMPPPAVRAYVAVIAEEPHITADAYRKSHAA